MNKQLLAGIAAVLIVPASSASAAELIVNGGFEQSTSPTATPTGWTNIGHSEGVIAYSAFDTPAYEGSYFYDFGGYGNSNGPAGDGIQQTVATTIGTLYTLTFGLSSEDYSGTTVLNLFFNGAQAASYTQTSTGLQFRKPFVTQTVSYLATSNSTTITFLQGAADGNGFNDPLIDGVSFQAAAASGVPEPATWAMMLAGFGAMGFAMRRRKKTNTARIRFA